jgi:hypothetical protein
LFISARILYPFYMPFGLEMDGQTKTFGIDAPFPLCRVEADPL